MKPIIIFMIILLGISGGAAADDPKAGEEINWQVISNGGSDGSSANYQLSGTVSQTAVDEGSSTNFRLSHGFWQTFISGEGPCEGKCGDSNGDNSVNVSDAVYIINYVFTSGGEPLPVLACGDANSDGSVNVSDAVYVINYVFTGGGAPGDCAPSSSAWYNGDCCAFTPKR